MAAQRAACEPWCLVVNRGSLPGFKEAESGVAKGSKCNEFEHGNLLMSSHNALSIGRLRQIVSLAFIRSAALLGIVRGAGAWSLDRLFGFEMCNEA
jgi:hypothetical protein